MAASGTNQMANALKLSGGGANKPVPDVDVLEGKSSTNEAKHSCGPIMIWRMP
jgi:hypothetical protein